jgi:hypothetical protein
MNRLTTQVANDLNNDSLILEVLREDGECLATVERFDADKKLRFQMLTEFLDVALVQEIFAIAHKELQMFEDGTPLVEAKRDFRFKISPDGN